MAHDSNTDIAGVKSGYLEVLYQIPESQNANTLWMCRCHNCGNVIPFKRSHLTRKVNPVISCGCLHPGGPARGGTNFKRILAKTPAQNSKTGIPGVTKDYNGKGYRARVDYCGVRYEFRGFSTIGEAALIRRLAQNELATTGTIANAQELAAYYRETF